MPAKNDATYSVPALEKGMHILEDLAASSEPVSIAELASKRGKSRNEIYRMVNCLESLGYLIRDASTRRYSLSLKLFHLANTHPPLARLRNAADAPLRELARRIRESCHICILNGNDISVVAQASGEERIRISFRLGATFDPLETCSGKLLLSNDSEAVMDRVLEVSPVWKAASQKERRSFRAELQSLRGERLREEDSQLRPGVRDIAVRIGRPGILSATIAVAHLTHRAAAVSRETIRGELLKTADEIETQLGITDASNPTSP